MNVSLAARPLSARENRSGLYKVVFDDRYAEGRTFAEVAQRLGVSGRALDYGDVTSFWYDELDLAWKKQPKAIAGMTQWGPMFVLERLASERRMRMILRIEHRVGPNGTLAHEIVGPPESAALAEDLERQAVEWPVLAALMVTQCRGACDAPVTRTVATPGTRPQLSVAAGAADWLGSAETVIHYYASATVRDGPGVPWDGPLYSWLIAPRVGA